MKKDLITLQKEFVNYRFGMFIHFNSATFQFNSTDISDWEYEHENGTAERLYPFNEADWNPGRLDCGQWVKAAKSAKMEFAALTAKHHEGFDLWPSKYTEHCIKNGTNKADVVKEYLEAFRSEGIVAGIYFSMLDIHNQINRKKCTASDKDFIKNQLTELLANYGEIPFIIIDGWQAHWGGPSYDNLPFAEVDELVKDIQPNCMLINISCESNLNHSDMVFYENAAGQDVDEKFNGPGVSCNILTNQWFWRKTDTTADLKSATWAVEKILEMNKQNVTFILNASPNIHGLIDDNLMSRYKEIGSLYKKVDDLTVIPNNWMKR